MLCGRVDKYIKEHKVECEWLPRRTYDACMSDEFVEYSTKALDGVRKAGSTEPVEVLQGDEAKKAGAPSSILALLRALRLVADLQATRVDDVRQSFGWDAATLNPAQLTLSIHTENLSLGGYDLFAWSPVHNVTEASDGLWNVHGPRGVVKAGKVVFATNAYSDALLPELEGLITPMRGGCRSMSCQMDLVVDCRSSGRQAGGGTCWCRSLPAAGGFLVSSLVTASEPTGPSAKAQLASVPASALLLSSAQTR